MKKIGLLIFALVFLAIFAPDLLAGDFADFKFIGFSKDGKYLAFEQAFSDGESDLYAYWETSFVETGENLLPPWSSTLPFSDSTPAKSKPALRLRYKKHVAVNLKKFGIVRGNVGQLVVAHLLSDWSFVKTLDPERNFTLSDITQTKKLMPSDNGAYVPDTGGLSEKIIFSSSQSDSVPITRRFYELTLNVETFKNFLGHDAYGINLTLRNNRLNREPKIQILLKDKNAIPEARQNACAYKIERVYVYKDKIAVFLNVFSPGVEGSRMSYMVVTGNLDKDDLSKIQ